tara:strand:- start:348 stop:530 length:183 start_codon:yes stop_codon:yes gene_type:complete
MGVNTAVLSPEYKGEDADAAALAVAKQGKVPAKVLSVSENVRKLLAYIIISADMVLKWDG